jgi:hypothetical protein
MDYEALRGLIRHKLADGRLPLDHIPRVWGGKGNGEVCHACDAEITTAEFVMEGISTTNGRQPLQLHVLCFQLWDAERRRAG